MITNTSIQTWILSGCLGLVLLLLGFVIKTITHQVIIRLDSIIKELKSLSNTSIVQEERIKVLMDANLMYNTYIATHSDLLTKHHERILKLEIQKCN